MPVATVHGLKVNYAVKGEGIPWTAELAHDSVATGEKMRAAR